METQSNYLTKLKIQLINELSRLDMKLPIAVKNAISDIFDENDDINENNLDINIYKLQDIDELNNDMFAHTNIKISDSGCVNLSFTKAYSHYNKYQFKYNESIKFIVNEDDYEKEEEIIISELEQNTNKLLDPNDYLVYLLEEHNFAENLYNKHYYIIIYMPI